MTLRKTALITPLILLPFTTHAADWIMLQGTEDKDSTKRATIFGMVQANYQLTNNSLLTAGPGAGNEALSNQINPQKSRHSGFNVKNARVGVRGAGFILDNRVNYLLAVEAGNNALTLNKGASLAEASITFRPTKNLNFRLGQMKTPTHTEGLASPTTQIFNNQSLFTSVIGNERFIDPNDRSKVTISAYRDVGLQLFGNLEGAAEWQHTYAIMLGNGSITKAEQVAGEDLYLKWSSFYLFNKGRKGFRQDFEITGWYHQGKRKSLGSNQRYNIDRYGVALNYLHDKLRFNLSADFANGKIMHGVTGGMKPGQTYGASQTAVYIETDKGTANGLSMALGYKVLPNLELATRYDNLQREGTSPAQKKLAERVTLAGIYRINPRTHLVANYEIKSGSSDDATTNGILDSMDNVLSIEMKHIF